LAPWDDVRAPIAGRLFVLDKCQDIRPIGIGKTLKRIIGKAVCLLTHSNAALACGTDGSCAACMVFNQALRGKEWTTIEEL